MLRNDNSLSFQSRQFRQACRDYRVRQEFITPYTPGRMGPLNGSCTVSKRSVSGNMCFRMMMTRTEPFATGCRGTTASGRIKPLGIEARLDTAHNNQLRWLDLGGALHVDHV